MSASPKPDVKQTDCNICDEEYDTKERKVVRAACHHELCLCCATDVVVRNKRFICPECTVEDKKLSAELRPVSAPASVSGAAAASSSGSATASAKVSASASASSSASGEEGAPSTDDNASAAPDHCRACTSCDSVGVQFCTTCRVAFCKRSAQESHRGPGFSDHKFVAMKDRMIDICAIHNAPYFYYCKECERLLCTVCERRHEKDAKTKDHQSDEVCIAHTQVLAKLAKLAEKLGGYETLQTSQSQSDEAAILTLRKAVEACLAVITEEATRKHAGVRERERALKEQVTTLAAGIIELLQMRSANCERVRGSLKDAADAIAALSSCFNLVVLRDASKVVQICDIAASAHDAVQTHRAVGVDVKLVVHDREMLFADAPKPFAAHHLRTEESEARKVTAEAKAEAEAKAAAKAKADAKAAANAKAAADAKLYSAAVIRLIAATDAKAAVKAQTKADAAARDTGCSSVSARSRAAAAAPKEH